MSETRRQIELEEQRMAALCDHTIRSHDVMPIPDARQDPRFSGNPLVSGDLNVVFSAGAPLISPEGHARP